MIWQGEEFFQYDQEALLFLSAKECEISVEKTNTYASRRIFWVESVQDFLIKLDMKPFMHLVEISTFSLNLVIARPTKIMNRADKNWAQF